MPTLRAVDDRIVPATGTGTRVPRGSGAPGAAGQGAGIGLGLLSAMCFGTSGTFGAALEGAGWSPAGAVLARVCVAALALTVPALFALRGRWALLRRSWRQVVVYGLVGVAACQVCYFNAIARMDVGISILLEYLGIVLVVGWLWVRHGQRPRLLTVLGGVAALGGLALMLDLSGSGGVSMTGVLFALAAAVSMAVYFFQSAQTSAAGGGDALPPVALTWGGMVTGAAFIALLGAARRHAAAVRVLLGDAAQRAGELAAAGARARRGRGGRSRTSPGSGRRGGSGRSSGSFVAMAEVLFAAGFAWVLLHQVPTGMQFLGGLLILAGVVAVRLDEP